VHAGFRGLRRFVARRKGWCILISYRFVLPHDTIPSTDNMKPITDNQFSEPIQRIFQRIGNLNWKPVYLLPSAIEFFALSIVMIVFIILWPYGIIPIITTFIWRLIEDSSNEIKGKTFANAMPYTVAIGIYSIIYLPFFIVCLPIYAIGFIGKYLSGL